MTTSDRPLRERVEAYLTSRRHVVGTVGGLAGVALALTGVSGPLWPLVVAGLYGAGALAVPSDVSPKERAEQMLREAATEAGRLRRDLDRLAEEVQARRGDLPPEASGAFTTVADQLAAMLGHPSSLVEPDVLHVLSTAIRKDLDAAVAAYLNLPRSQRQRPLATGRLPGEELTYQLALMKEYVDSTADQVFSGHLSEIVELTIFLEARKSLEGSELDLSRDDP